MRITYSQTTDGLEVALTALARGDTAALTPYLYEIASSIKLSNTLVNVHCHCLKLDGNGRPRLNDLIAKTAQYILNFAIPRSHIKDSNSRKANLSPHRGNLIFPVSQSFYKPPKFKVVLAKDF